MPDSPETVEHGVDDAPLWQALTVFRLAALSYAVVRFVPNYHGFAHPADALLILCALVVWTGVTIIVFHHRARRALPMVIADLGMAVAAVLLSRVVATPAAVSAGEITIPTLWAACPVVSCAIVGGWPGGLLAAIVLGAADVVERGGLAVNVMHNDVMLALLGGAIGYVGSLTRAASRAMAHAQRVDAATRERQRLARDIHDSVLQVLALVQRRCAEVGATELSRLAGEQESSLRALVTSWRDADAAEHAERVEDGVPLPPGPLSRRRAAALGAEPRELDLRDLAGRFASPDVTVSAPDTAVSLPAPVARDLTAALSAALDNVRAHAPGAHAWILVEDDDTAVTVSIRDDGPGMPAARAATAAAEGRLGIAQSIRGRIADLGGSVTIVSAPGEGVEIEMTVPRAAVATRRAGRPMSSRHRGLAR
jgi:signal transduction histidine kinase